MKHWYNIIGSFIVFICALICIADGCKKDSSDKSIDVFVFEASKNQGLTEDVVAHLDDNDRITAILPYGVNVKSLVATFSYVGKQVTVNNTAQTSGVSVNDFSDPVEYVVKAEDNSIRRYLVMADVANNTISKFEFRRSLNSELPRDVTAIIRNDSIIVNLPDNVSTTNLIATYATYAQSVTVNGVKQSSGISRNDFSSTVKYMVTGMDGSKRTYQAVVKTNIGITKFWVKKSLNPPLKQDIVFNINHNNLTIEGTYLQWIDASNPSRMVVSFEAPDALVESGGVAIPDRDKVVDFSQPVQFTTTSGNHAPRTYTVTLICPQITGTLPILRIEADGPITSKNNYVSAKLEIVGKGITEGLWNFSKEKIGIRLRGNSTMGLPKKPYRIKFPEKYSPLGLNHTKEKSWVLLANDADKSLIRNAVAFQISRIMQSDASYRRFVPCTQFVDLYLNGQYNGNYHLTDQVQVAPGRVEVQSLTSSDAADASTISGGYLLELDGFADGEPLWFNTLRKMKITIKNPDSDDYAPEQATWITNYVTNFENILFSQDFTNPVIGWRKYIDINSWVDHCIANEMAGNPDVWWQTFMSKERNVDYFVFGPVWDFDIAFNNDVRINNAINRLMIDAAHDPNKVWISRFMQDETFKVAVKERWNAKEGELRGLPAYVDELALLLDMSQKANFKRWDIHQQTLGHAQPPPASYQAAIAQLKSYLQDRYNFLDTEFKKW